jgi:hypothetical protein
VAEVDAIVAANPGSHVGTLDETVILAVRQVITDSRIFSGPEKAAILSQWPQVQ